MRISLLALSEPDYTAAVSIARVDMSSFGRSVVGRPFDVTEERIAAYAAATSDTASVARATTVAPLAFAIVPAFDLLAELAMSVVADRRSARFLHGEHVIRQHRPLRPGDIVVAEGAIVGIRATSAGALVITRTTSRTLDEEALSEQMSSTLIVSHTADHSVGIGFPRPRPFEVPSGAAVSQAFDEDQTYRYAEASGDRAPIHLDNAAARAAGLPGIIIHGLCTFAFAARAAADLLCPDNPERLYEVSCRFVTPVRPGDLMVTTFEQHGQAPGRAFVARVADVTVLTDGWASVTAP